MGHGSKSAMLPALASETTPRTNVAASTVRNDRRVRETTRVGKVAGTLGRTVGEREENVTIARSALLAVALVAVLTVAPDAPAGGISDETCPNVAGEHTNTCPAGTVGVPYSIRFTESEGSGCGPGRQTFHFDSGILPPGMTLALDGTLSGTSFQPGSFQFYVEMREPRTTLPTAPGSELRSSSRSRSGGSPGSPRFRRHVSVGGWSAFPYRSTSPRRLRHLRVVARLRPTPRRDSGSLLTGLSRAHRAPMAHPASPYEQRTRKVARSDGGRARHCPEAPRA